MVCQSNSCSWQDESPGSHYHVQHLHGGHGFIRSIPFDRIWGFAQGSQRYHRGKGQLRLPISWYGWVNWLTRIMIKEVHNPPTDPSILASSEEAVMLGDFLRELVRSAGMSDDTAASEAKALLDQLGIQHGKRSKFWDWFQPSVTLSLTQHPQKPFQ